MEIFLQLKELMEAKFGKLHRDNNLQALEYPDGTKMWFKNGKRHRENDLPAIEYPDETKMWFKNGYLHREGGLPAFEDLIGKEWWVNGIKWSQEDGFKYFSFCKRMNEKKRIKAQKKIFFWWIPICYDLTKPCGQRMALFNLFSFNEMME